MGKPSVFPESRPLYPNPPKPRMSQAALWDHYAGLAMAALLSRPQLDDKDEPSFEFIARTSYRMADVMLACREEDGSE